jgi:hypothetical protein
MDTRACGMGLMRGVYAQFTTENIFCSKNIRYALPHL